VATEAAKLRVAAAVRMEGEEDFLAEKTEVQTETTQPKMMWREG
jgi:hypothetical protein